MRVLEYFGLAGQPMAAAVAEDAQQLREQVAHLERLVQLHTEEIEALRAEMIRLRAKL